MKKIFVLGLIASAFLFGCSDDTTTTTPTTGSGSGGGSEDNLAVTDVMKENNSFAVKFSGTNCPPCGGWGWTMASSLKSGIEGSGEYITAYGSNPYAALLIADEATTLQNAWGAAGYPHFGANGSVTDIPRPGSVNVAAEEAQIFERVNDHAAADVVANTTVKYEIVDGVMNMKYKTAAWSDLSSPYLAIYIVEDKVKAYQAGHSEGNDALHKNVLRKEITAEAGYGSPIEGLAVGTDVSGEASFELDSDWDESHIKVIAVMYNRVGTKYTFVNLSTATLVE
jgi:hypothetical protein